MSKDYVLYEKKPDKKIATITFNRPEKLNAATIENREELKAKVVQKEMMLTGTPLTAQEAAECGL